MIVGGRGAIEDPDNRHSGVIAIRNRLRPQDSELTRIVGNERLDKRGHFSIGLAPEVSEFIVAKAESFYAPE